VTVTSQWRFPGSGVALLLPCLGAACALADVFAASGPRDVTFAWQGPPDLTINVAVPLQVTVLVDGEPVANPPLRFFPDSTRIVFGATADSIVGKQNGRGELRVRLESSIATTPVDTVFAFQIHP
jgi:hypothetical protein